MLAVRKIGGLAEVPQPQGPRAFEAAAIIGAGVLSATALILHGRGYNNEAYALGATGALLGATFAALKLAGGSSS